MLRYEGAVGSGLSSAETHALEVVLADIETPESPFHGYPAPTAAAGDVLRWTGPVLVVDVEHLGRTANGLLRQPSAARLRPDLDYGDLVEGRGA
jgi:bifunctional non-homologous end joining protein LigD